MNTAMRRTTVQHEKTITHTRSGSCLRSRQGWGGGALLFFHRQLCPGQNFDSGTSESDGGTALLNPLLCSDVRLLISRPGSGATTLGLAGCGDITTFLPPVLHRSGGEGCHLLDSLGLPTRSIRICLPSNTGTNLRAAQYCKPRRSPHGFTWNPAAEEPKAPVDLTSLGRHGILIIAPARSMLTAARAHLAR